MKYSWKIVGDEDVPLLRDILFFELEIPPSGKKIAAVEYFAHRLSSPFFNAPVAFGLSAIGWVDKADQSIAQEFLDRFRQLDSFSVPVEWHSEGVGFTRETGGKATFEFYERAVAYHKDYAGFDGNDKWSMSATYDLAVRTANVFHAGISKPGVERCSSFVLIVATGTDGKLVEDVARIGEALALKKLG